MGGTVLREAAGTDNRGGRGRGRGRSLPASRSGAGQACTHGANWSPGGHPGGAAGEDGSMALAAGGGAAWHRDSGGRGQGRGAGLGENSEEEFRKSRRRRNLTASDG